VIRIVRHGRNEVRLVLDDPEGFSGLLDASHSRAVLEVTPLTRASSRIRETWKTLGRLAGDEMESAREHGRMSLGDLPAGTYFLWMVVPAGGAWNAEIRVAGGSRVEDFAVSVTPSRDAVAGRLLRDGAPVAKALVIDGYVPHYRSYELYESADRLGRYGDRVEARCLDYSDEDGSFRIPVHNSGNAWLSVIPGDGSVYHLEKADLVGRESWELEHHPGDVVVRGRIVDEEGVGLPGLRVSVAPLGGADERILAQTPHPHSIHPDVTGEDGAFEVPGVRPGVYLLAVCFTRVTRDVENNLFLQEATRIVDVRELPRDGLRVVVGEEQLSTLERAKKAWDEGTGHDHR
jgi:hypothetical protein